MTTLHRVLCLSGSLRQISANTAVLQTARQLAPAGLDLILYEGLATLPLFNPDDEIEPLPAPVQALRVAVGASDALLIACPEYAHGVPGAFKNLLDWLVGSLEFPGKPVALLNASGRGSHHAQDALREILLTMSARMLDAACATVRRRVPVAKWSRYCETKRAALNCARCWRHSPRSCPASEARAVVFCASLAGRRPGRSRFETGDRVSIKPDKWIRRMAEQHGMIEPFEPGQVKLRDGQKLVSYGTSSYGYDVRCAREFKIFTNINSTIVDPKAFDPTSFVDVEADVCIIPPNSFALARTVEFFRIPRKVLTICLGKSTYARCGIIVNVTPLEPEWEGHVTLEFSNTTPLPAKIYANEGVAQMLFLESDEECETSYKDRGGKYQGQQGVTLPRT